MSPEERAEQLRRELFFRTITVTRPPPAVARALGQAIKPVYFPAGTTLFKKGDDPEDVFFIAEGEVDLEAPGEEPWHFGKGSVVGILDVNMNRPRVRTAVARTDIEAMVLKGEDWIEVLEDNFDYAVATRAIVARDLYLQASRLPHGGFERAPEHDENMRPPEMSPVASLVVLINMKAFATAGVQALSEVAAAAEVVELEAGDTLFDVGGAGGCIYAVAWGIVELDHPGPPRLGAAFGAGSLLGGAFAYCGKLEVCAARARTAAVLLKLKLTDIDDIAEDHFDLTRAVMRHLALERERLMRIAANLDRDRKSAPPPVLASSATSQGEE